MHRSSLVGLLGLLAVLVLVGTVSFAGCRDDLCVRTLVADCPCDDPLQPLLDHCMSQFEVVSCAPVDASVVDPCRLAPCCKGPRDAAAPPPPDLRSMSSDGP